MGKIAVVYHDDFTKYDMGKNHPFRGGRYQCFDEVFSHEILAARKDDITFVRPKPAGDEAIRATHGNDYIDLIEALDRDGGILTLDTPVPQGIYSAAKLFAGANILAGRLVLEGIRQRVVVLGLGAHHAGYDFGGGFSIINDIAVMIEYLRSNYAVKKIAVIDFDAHCGDGTQDIYYFDPGVLCIDIHQDPLTIFPGWGFSYQIGLGQGLGYTINLPFPPGASDRDFELAFSEICVPVVKEFQPEILVATGSLDAHSGDPMSGLNLSSRGYLQLMKSICNMAEEACQNKMVLILGGSYNLQLVPEVWLASIAAVLEAEPGDYGNSIESRQGSESQGEQAVNLIGSVKELLKTYWTSL